MLALLLNLGFAGGGDVLPYTPADVTVRALRPGYFGGLRAPGDTFDISAPGEFSPYWMALVDTPPENWSLGVYSKLTDIAHVQVRGRYEDRDYIGEDLGTETDPGPWDA